MEFLQSTPEKSQRLFTSLGCKELNFSKIEATTEAEVTKISKKWLIPIVFLVLLPVVSQVDSNMSLEKQVLSFYGWITEEDQISIIKPVICGLLFSIFSCSMIYFDGNVPGIEPASPFSSSVRSSFRLQKRDGINCSYLTAIATGLIVALISYFNF